MPFGIAAGNHQPLASGHETHEDERARFEQGAVEIVCAVVGGIRGHVKSGDIAQPVRMIGETVQAAAEMQFHHRARCAGGEEIPQSGQREVVAGVDHERSGAGLRGSRGGLLIQGVQLVGEFAREDFAGGAIRLSRPHRMP